MTDLADFQFSIRYRPGKENVDADYLSRRSLNVEELKAECTEEYDPREIGAVIAGVSVSRPAVVNQVSVKQVVLEPEKVGEVSVSVQELIEKQVADPVIGPIYESVRLGRRPGRAEWAQLCHGHKLQHEQQISRDLVSSKAMLQH